MPTKRRKIPEVVLAHRERKQRFAASLAKLQGAALGKSARERLKPLIEAAPLESESREGVGRISLSMAEISKRFSDAVMQSMLTQPPNWFQPISFQPRRPLTFSLSNLADDVEPTITPERLNALKQATPYKVKPRVPDMVEVITGWRGWALNGGRLQALGQSHTWPAKEALIAECARRAEHIAPGWNCNCGVWAFKDLERLTAAIGSGYNAIKVIGSVSLWGRVIETENGYRAQYAYPSELWLLDESLEELGLIYDVPVRR